MRRFATLVVLLARLQATTSRVLGSLIGLAVLGVGALVVGGGTLEFVRFVEVSLMGLLAPVVALVFAVACLGDLREDGTLSAVWLRPLPRWHLAAAGVCATALLVVPLAGGAGLLLAVLAGQPALAAPAAVAAAGGGLAYGSAFVALGLRTTRSLLAGLGYVLVVEGFLVGLAATLGAVSVRRYATTLLSELGGVPVSTPPASVLAAAVALGLVTVGGWAACTWWLRTREVP